MADPAISRHLLRSRPSSSSARKLPFIWASFKERLRLHLVAAVLSMPYGIQPSHVAMRRRQSMSEADYRRTGCGEGPGHAGLIARHSVDIYQYGMNPIDNPSRSSRVYTIHEGSCRFGLKILVSPVQFREGPHMKSQGLGRFRPGPFFTRRREKRGREKGCPEEAVEFQEG